MAGRRHQLPVLVHALVRPRHIQAVLAGAGYVLLLWLVASALRGKGLLLFAAGLVAGAAALYARRIGRSRPLLTLVYGTLLAAATVASVEAVLRLAPGVLRGWLANYVFNGYHGERDGTLQPDPYLGVALRPGVRRWMYWNAHWWWHEANPRGYRGSAAAVADAVFIGDSMVYGHGVGEADTLPAQFSRQTGLKAANLGQQGTCLVQGLQLFRAKGLPLRPRHVFVSSHPTDLLDAFFWYDAAEIDRFIVDPGYVPRAKPQFTAPRNVLDVWAQHVALPLRAARLLHAILARPSRWEFRGAEGMTGDRFVPGRDWIEQPFAPTPAEQQGWRAHREAAARIKKLADTVGARTVLFDLGYPAAFSAAVERLAGEIGATYSPAGRRALARAQAGGEMYLARDGHWTPEGAAVIAEALAKNVDGTGAGR
jgi:hypothetical protein